MADQHDTSVRSYRDLVAWQQAFAVATSCYRTTRSFPQSEICGMTAQVRRAAVSVLANIAEGNGRESTGAYIQFLGVAQGSLMELETHLLLAEAVELLKKGDCEELLAKCERVGKLLRALVRALQQKEASSQ